MTQPSPTHGFAFIGDPHLAGRSPGFRRDDYPRVSLRKLRWCLDAAKERGLQPVLLGDLFHWPRENPNWLLAELLSLCTEPIPCVVGNHDIRENTLSPHDSITLLQRAHCLHILDLDGPLCISLSNALCVVLGGTSWGQPLPTAVSATDFGLEIEPDLTLWITHHDIAFPKMDFPDFVAPREIPGIDVIINGHIHLPQPSVRCGSTLWLNPGNIVRLSRDVSTQMHMPSILCVRPKVNGEILYETLNIPHEPFNDVFYEKHTTREEEREEDPYNILGRPSPFVLGLEELAAQKTDAGAGLTHFLDQNIARLQPETQNAVIALALHVLPDDHPWRENHETKHNK